MKKYIYIDDEDDKSIQPIVEGLNRSGKILVERLPLERDEPINNVYKRLMNNPYDGIIIDYMLNGSGPFHIGCNSHSITQYVRDLADSGTIRSCPIVLCSTDQNLHQQLQRGYTTNDLYDYHLAKDYGIDYDYTSTRLECLANGYERIANKSDNLESIVGRDISLLDLRPFEPYLIAERNVQQCADVILKDLFKYSGLLISEEILCTRLGIARTASFHEITRLFDAAKYTGIFYEWGNYYWMDKVREIFQDIFHANIAAMDASEKLKLLQEHHLGITLEEAPTDPYNISKRYWTNCVVNGIALDPIEGYQVLELGALKPWQECRYVSFSAISSGEADKVWPLMDGELERFRQKVDFLNERNHEKD